MKDRKIDPPKIVDSFDWEQGIVQKIKEWIKKAQVTVEDAFKCFDKDFDGFVSKVVWKHALVSLWRRMLNMKIRNAALLQPLRLPQAVS